MTIKYYCGIILLSIGDNKTVNLIITNKVIKIHIGRIVKMINTTRLRCTIGWLGMLLPWIVLILSKFYGCSFPDSISATYYLPTCITPFMIILGSAGLLLFSYKGYDRQDDIICTIAGIFALGICLFSCNTENLVERWVGFAELTRVGTFQIVPNISGMLHNICAFGFFGLLAYNSLFLFTKSSGKMTENKKKRNIIFRVCGLGMIISFLAIVPVSIFEWWGGVWIIETVALFFFGISWLTKADYYPWLFADKK